jgi:hypothetical protein
MPLVLFIRHKNAMAKVYTYIEGLNTKSSEEALIIILAALRGISYAIRDGFLTLRDNVLHNRIEKWIVIWISSIKKI